MANDTFQIQDDYHKFLVDSNIPKVSDGSYDKCYIKAYKNETVNNATNTNLPYTKQKCNSWVYSDLIYKKTIVTDVSLILFCKINY